MAARVIHKKEKPAPPPEPVEPRENENEEMANDLEKSRSRVEQYFDGKDAPETFETHEGDQPPSPSEAIEPAVVGGKDQKGGTQLPPIAEVKEDVTPKPGEIETPEQLQERLDKIKPQNREQEKHFGPLKDIIKEKDTQLRELKAKADEALTKVKELEGKVLPEDEVKRLRAIEKGARMEAIDKLPRFKAFDDEISGLQSRAVDFLKSCSVPILQNEQTLKAIEAKGGLFEFANSKESAGIKGSSMTRAEYFQKFIYDKLDARDKNRFDLLANEADDKRAAKVNAIEEAKKDDQKTFQQESENFWTQFNKEAGEEIQTLAPLELKKFDLPFEKPTIPATATKEEKEKLTKTIELWEKTDKKIVENTMVVKAKDRARVGFKSAMYDVLVDMLTDNKSEIEKITKERDELQKFKDGVQNSKRRLPKSSVIPAPVEPKDKFSPGQIPAVEDRLAAKGFK